MTLARDPVLRSAARFRTDQTARTIRKMLQKLFPLKLQRRNLDCLQLRPMQLRYPPCDIWLDRCRSARHRLPRDLAVQSLHRIGGTEGQCLRQHLVERDAQRVEITARNDRSVHPAGLFGGHIREKILISGALTLLTNAVIAYNRGQAATLRPGRPLRYWPGCPAAIEFSLKSPLSSD